MGFFDRVTKSIRDEQKREEACCFKKIIVIFFRIFKSIFFKNFVFPLKENPILGVVFELRGKPFGLRDSGYPESIYSLCRKWMYGKDDEPEAEKDEDPALLNPLRFQSLVNL